MRRTSREHRQRGAVVAIVRSQCFPTLWHASTLPVSVPLTAHATWPSWMLEGHVPFDAMWSIPSPSTRRELMPCQRASCQAHDTRLPYDGGSQADGERALVHMRCSAVGALLRTWCALNMTTEGLNHARRGDSSARCPGTRYGSHHTWTKSFVP
jgi:hypothetical protein